MNTEPLWEYQNPNIKRHFREVIHTDLLTPEKEVELAEKHVDETSMLVIVWYEQISDWSEKLQKTI